MRETIKLKTGGIPESEYNFTFLQGMVTRMGVSFHRYGYVKDAYPEKVDALRSLQQRIDKYLETGNLEFLVDVANFAMIEYMRPRHPKAFFKATDSESGESPGRTKVGGTVTTKHNLDLK